jgi:hypothetical protein
MNPTLLKCSLCLNLILLSAVGYWAVKTKCALPVAQMNDVAETSSEITNDTVAADPPALRWSSLESADYPTYIANLRKAGCSEPVLRRIISTDLKDLYAKKAFALVNDFHRDFWEIAARQNVEQYYEKTFAPQVKALCSEPDALLKQLLGDAPPEPPNAPPSSSLVSRFANFLSSQKQEQLRQLGERYEPLMQSLQQAENDEQPSQLNELRAQVERERAEILSPDELAEYHLRQTIAAYEVRNLYGVDFSETELRNLAKALDAYHHRKQNPADVESETLDQKLEAAIGPARFTDFNRSRSAIYRELYDFVSDFGQPAQAAAAIFDLRLESEKQSDEIRADRVRSREDKQLLLDDLQDRAEQGVRTKLGEAAFQSYKSASGKWISALGRL